MYIICRLYVCCDVSAKELPRPCLDQAPQWMERPLAVGGVSGLAGSLLVTLARNLVLENQDPGFSLPNCIPSCLDGANLSIEELPWLWFLGGLVVGLSVGPLVDLLWLWKQRWRRFVLSEAAGGNSQRALHKVLA